MQKGHRGGDQQQHRSRHRQQSLEARWKIVGLNRVFAHFEDGWVVGNGIERIPVLLQPLEAGFSIWVACEPILERRPFLRCHVSGAPRAEPTRRFGLQSVVQALGHLRH
ncbi:hypothetical protein D9M73_91120 [compost metagenome]